MANTNKMTKTEMFTAIATYIQDAAQYDVATANVSPDKMLDFINRQIEAIENKAAKSSSKSTKTQTENEAIKDKIINALIAINKPVTITEMQEQTPELAVFSNQKLSALMRQLQADGEVIKATEKKKSYFTVPAADEEEDEDEIAEQTEEENAE